MTRTPQLDGNAGIRRDAAYRDRRIATQPEPIAALANAANSVNAAAEKSALEPGDFIALVTSEGVVKPLAVDTLKQWLEATYILTPQP